MPTILVFLKSPVRGTVKTRLAASIGAEKAREVYQALASSQLSRLPIGWKREIHFSPSTDRLKMQKWLGKDEIYYPQTNGDLGQRLAMGIAGAFRRGASTVYAIGGDCPQLNATHFESAHTQLETGAADVVFGPTEDGGYYLMALSRMTPSLFQNIPWSSHKTLEASLSAAKSAGLVTVCLPTLRDVDTIEDYQALVGYRAE